MTRWQLIQRLQNSPLTRWLWQYWIHIETGEITIVPFWRHPGEEWYPAHLKE